MFLKVSLCPSCVRPRRAMSSRSSHRVNGARPTTTVHPRNQKRKWAASEGVDAAKAECCAHADVLAAVACQRRALRIRAGTTYETWRRGCAPSVDSTTRCFRGEAGTPQSGLDATVTGQYNL